MCLLYVPGIHSDDTSHLQLHPAAVATRAGDHWPGTHPGGCLQLPALQHREALVPALGISERNGTSGASPTVAASDQELGLWGTV